VTEGRERERERERRRERTHTTLLRKGFKPLFSEPGVEAVADVDRQRQRQGPEEAAVASLPTLCHIFWKVSALVHLTYIMYIKTL
jgi:hypothetical protein